MSVYKVSTLGERISASVTLVTVLLCVVCMTESHASSITSTSHGRRGIRWSSTKSKEPACESWPEKPLHGSYRWLDLNSIEYLCRRGYSLLGNAYDKCVGGRWSSSPPICLGGKCPLMMTSLEHGYLVVSLHGTLVRFICRPGFTLRGASDTLACVDGHWNGTRPACSAAKLNGKSPASITAAGRRPGHKDYQVALAANERPPREHAPRNGAANKRAQQMTQSSNGVAISRTHDELLAEADYTCVAATKQVPPPAIPDAQSSMRLAMIDSHPRLYAVYRCQMGFAMSGAIESTNLYCRRGNWVGVIPVCVPLTGDRKSLLSDVIGHRAMTLEADYTCLGQTNQDHQAGAHVAPPPDVHRATWSYGNDVIEGKPRLFVKYTCIDGLVLKNVANEHLYCKNGSWIGVRPVCIVVSCRYHNGGCGHLCSDVTKTPSDRSVKCACRRGYELDDDQRTCRDIDECTVNNADCHHLCDNTDGSFRCSCYPGFQLQSDQRTCL